MENLNQDQSFGSVKIASRPLHYSFYTYIYIILFLKIFEGNTDGDSIVTHNLAPVMVLNSIQIHPKACNRHCALRVEFLGCYKGYFFFFCILLVSALFPSHISQGEETRKHCFPRMFPDVGKIWKQLW